MTVATVAVRLPTFFEPAWHADEGTFAAVAQKLLMGGGLYSEAWESKPPLFLYMYAAIFKLFGAGMLPLRIAVAVAALGATFALYLTGRRLVGERAALIAAGVLLVMLGVPFWDGNLALTEIFSLLPAMLALYCLLRAAELPSGDRREFHWLLASGMLFGLTVLIRQPTAIIAIAALTWLAIGGRPWVRPAALLAAGSSAVLLPTVLAFAVFGSLSWFWDANVVFFFSYIPEAREVPVYLRPLVLAPVVATIAALVVLRRVGESPAWGLPALWFVLTLASAVLSGRPYPHYFIPVIPGLALLAGWAAVRLATLRLPSRQEIPLLAIAGSAALVWFLVVVPAFDGDLFARRYVKRADYYPRFVERVLGFKTGQEYRDYFDRRVNLTEQLALRLQEMGAAGETVYIWGEYPWVYPLSGTRPATRYVTSFYVLQIPGLAEELERTLLLERPLYIIVMEDSWPRIADPTGALRWRFERAQRGLDRLIAARYEEVAVMGKARIYGLRSGGTDAPVAVELH